MLLVALTGSIATGKTVVAAIFKELGCYVSSSDTIAHELILPHNPAWKKIISRFGNKILNKDQTINRKKLGKLIFLNNKDRQFLNSLLHPLVMERKKIIIQSLKKEKKYRIFISEAALTIEAGLTDFFDKIIVTYCRSATQLQRLQKRDDISRKEALSKISSQMPQKDKIKVADYIINTSGNLRKTIEETEQVYRYLLQDFQLHYGKLETPGKAD
jgi:dephospho-CoA kinase